jgi:proton-dependent oligopeptide transporter, POT family
MSEQPTEKKSVGQVVIDSFKELGQTLVAFAKAPKALWGINLPYVMEGLVYFGILTILGKFCSENIQLSDQQASWVYSGVTAGITLAMLFLGGVSDKIGIRNAMKLAFSMFLIGRTIIALSGTLSLGTGMGSPMFFMTILGLTIMVVAYGLYQPAAYAGVKRYTTPKTAAMGYAVVYGLMNLGAFFSGAISPFVRRFTEESLPPNGLAGVFWVYAGMMVLALLATTFILTKKTDEEAVARVAKETAEEAEGGDTPEKKTEETPASPVVPKANINNLPFIILLVATLGVAGFGLKMLGAVEKNPAIYVLVGAGLLAVLSGWEFMRHRPEHPFRDHRFTFFIFILIPVQTLFAHNWLTLPYYLDRAFAGGMVSDNFEFFSNLNPIMIFFLAPIVAGLTARANVYKMMILGTLVMALPTFLLAIGPNIYLFLTYVLLMSVGEAMWQPRFLQWIAEIAPKGKEGMYMGIGQFPWFLTKMVTGLYSGFFVAKYLPRPESGLDTNSGVMWFIYALIAMVTPVALILARKWMVAGMREKATN